MPPTGNHFQRVTLKILHTLVQASPPPSTVQYIHFEHAEKLDLNARRAKLKWKSRCLSCYHTDHRLLVADDHVVKIEKHKIKPA